MTTAKVKGAVLLARRSFVEEEYGREAWEQVAAVDPTFCEVEQRLAALEDAKPEPEPEPDAGFESFSDLFEAGEEVEEAGEDAASEPVEASESFEDLISEVNEAEAEDDEDGVGFPDPGDTASAAQEPAAPQPEEPAVPAAPQPEAPVAPQPEPPRRRRKKKISFV